MRAALFIGLLPAFFATGCQLPRPVTPDQEMGVCQPGSEAPAGALLFVSVRMPDCRTANIGMTALRGAAPTYGAIDDRRRVTLLTETAWRAAAARQLRADPGRSPILYVHGFNNDNQAALDRAIAIRVAVGDGRPVFALTWPSYAQVPKYFWDEANAEWAISEADRQVAALASPARPLTIVAHSMGNRVALHVVREARRRFNGRALTIERLIMASPDVDRAEAQRELGAPGGVGTRVTLYGSRKDQPLSASWRMHGYARAGDLSRWVTGQDPDYRAFAGFDAVDVVDTSNVSNDFLAHAAFIESPEGAADLCRVVRGVPHGTTRAAIDGGPANYWALTRAQPSDPCSRPGWDAAAWLSKLK